jgi:hypothetical protein
MFLTHVLHQLFGDKKNNESLATHIFCCYTVLDEMKVKINMGGWMQWMKSEYYGI